MSSQSSHLQASPSALVELRRASKSFAPQSLAVRDLSIAMGPDTYVVVVGPSGCGKTTLLRLIAGLESPTSGTVHIGGSDAASLPPHARGVALAAQGAPLYPHLTVRENLGFAARARLVPAAVVRDRVEAIAQSLLITDFLARHFETFLIRPLGLDRFPDLRDTYFGHYERALHLAQTDDPELERKARSAAARLGLRFERKLTGYGDLGDALARL